MGHHRHCLILTSDGLLSLKSSHSSMYCLKYLVPSVQIWEFADTLIMILKKNDRQITFLHVSSPRHNLSMVSSCASPGMIAAWPECKHAPSLLPPPPPYPADHHISNIAMACAVFKL